MSFLSGVFLTALVAAGGPLIIHLLNRRRRRTIYWGPMDFLVEVIKRSRRILHLRDVALLALRTLVVILFVLAMSRPYWSAGADAGGTSQPMHAVIVIDNSLSMGYAEIDKSLLTRAKAKASEFIEALPSGSEMSIIPLCSEAAWRDVYRTTEDALDAVGRIEVVDRSVAITDGFSQARQACDLVQGIRTKRVVMIGDVQQRSWSLDGAESYLEGISDIQIVQVDSAKKANTWVDDFRLLHGIADTDSTAVFRAVIRNEGKSRDVQVKLAIGDEEVDSRDVKLIDGHELQLDFHHKFLQAGTSSQPLFIPAKLTITPGDGLVMDDFRALIVPVVARTPVLFIDQHGRGENPAENMYGETARVRKLLSSGSRSSSGGKQLVRQVLRTISEVTREDLKEARLVVLGGVEMPTPESVSMLREYVEQGGNIFLAAGGMFDPVRWNATAWLDGAGILPTPLGETPVGRIPQANQTRLEVFGLDAASVVGRALHLDTNPQETESILNTPKFFKAVVADVEAARKAISESERKRIEERRKWMAQYDENQKKWSQQEAAGKLSAQGSAQRQAARRKADAMAPKWLLWRNPLARDDSEFEVDDLVNMTQPRVLGKYDNGHPFVVERQIGKGRVVMLTSGMWPKWNTLALDNGVLLLDRIMRSLLVRSLPDRTFGPEKEITVPVSAAHQGVSFSVKEPGKAEPRLQGVEALGSQSFGLLLRSIQKRGVYTIERQDPAKDGDETKQEKWSMSLAVNGLSDESELASIPSSDIPDSIAETSISLVQGDEKISLAGKTYIGHDFWWVLMLLTLGCVLLEMVLLTGWRLAGLPKAGASTDGTDQTAAPEITQ